MSISARGSLRQSIVLLVGIIVGAVLGMAFRNSQHPRTRLVRPPESLAIDAFASVLKGQYETAAGRVETAQRLAANPRGEQWMSILFLRPSAIGEIYDLEDTPSAGMFDSLDAGVIATLLSGVNNDSSASTFYGITYLLDIAQEAVVAESGHALSAADRSRHLGQLRDLAHRTLINKYALDCGFDGIKWRRHILNISS